MLYVFDGDEVKFFQQGSLNEEELLDDVFEASSNSSTLTSADVGIITNVLMTVSMEALQNETVSYEWFALLVNKVLDIPANVFIETEVIVYLRPCS